MNIFVSDSGNLDRRKWCIDHNVGSLMSPEYGTLSNVAGVVLMVDNGAYGAWSRGAVWNESAFYRFVDRAAGSLADLVGVVCPDIVCGGLSSLIHSGEHIKNLSDFPVYLAVQPGIMPSDVVTHLKKYPDYAGLFVGGGDNVSWKWRMLSSWVDLAHKRNLKCHVGRVGNVRGYMAAAACGVDSVDGSNLMRNDRLGEIERYRRMQEQQKNLIN
jgi:hypothetical protein